MKGQLPITQMIILESNESQWRLLTQGLIKELKITGIIEKEPNMKVRVNLVINTIFPPERSFIDKTFNIETNLGEAYTKSMLRSFDFLNSFLIKTVWFFFGYIDGEEKIPILIMHISTIDKTIYTQKLKEEETKNFFPSISMN